MMMRYRSRDGKDNPDAWVEAMRYDGNIEEVRRFIGGDMTESGKIDDGRDDLIMFNVTTHRLDIVKPGEYIVRYHSYASLSGEDMASLYEPYLEDAIVCPLCGLGMDEDKIDGGWRCANCGASLKR